MTTRPHPRARDLVLSTLRLSQDNRVLVARVDAPPHNYMTPPMQGDFARLAAAVERDHSVGAVVVTGAPSGRYILHFDLAQVEAAVTAAPTVSQRTATRLIRAARAVAAVGGRSLLARTPLAGVNTLLGFHQTALTIQRSPAVWIAAVNGPCAGAGLELSLFFDIRLAATTASFAMPELSIALNPPFGGQRLAQLMNPARATEFMLEARFYTAAEAHHTGLANQVIPDDQLLDTALTAAARYASRPRDQVQRQKQIFNDSHARTTGHSLTHEAGAQLASASSTLFRRTVRHWLTMRGDPADTLFLTQPEPWINGTAIDLNPTDHAAGAEHGRHRCPVCSGARPPRR